MKKYKNNETIEVLGASFNGVKDMIVHARKRIPKDGVYVGEDSQLYPCFDNFIVNMLGAIAAYCMFPKKPCINVQRAVDTQLSLF